MVCWQGLWSREREDTDRGQLSRDNNSSNSSSVISETQHRGSRRSPSLLQQGEGSHGVTGQARWGAVMHSHRRHTLDSFKAELRTLLLSKLTPLRLITAAALTQLVQGGNVVEVERPNVARSTQNRIKKKKEQDIERTANKNVIVSGR